jgi:hypothetical protein
MRRVCPCLLFAVLLSVGCLPFQVRKPDEKVQDVPYRSEKASPVVTAESINEGNAAQKAKELRAELERAKREGARSGD